MAVPKGRRSSSKRDKGRTHKKLHKPAISTCNHCGEVKLPHRMCSHCGYYKDRAYDVTVTAE
ncbi:MAG: 50S ribosomal protein L32 [Candidatus Sumerlaeota bacterium]